MNKSDFEIKAIVAGASQKEMLDFECVFREVTGNSLESPEVNEDYLKSQGMATAIACRALLDKKLAKDGIDKIIGVFETYCC